MTHASAFDSGRFSAQVEQLKRIALMSTDRCDIAMLIAVSDERVVKLLPEKFENFDWKGIFCVERDDGKVAVVFNFECRAGQFCLVKPWFAVVVDLEFGMVYGQPQDPYRPKPLTVRKPCSCSGPAGQATRRPPECVFCQGVTGYDDLVSALNKAKDAGKFGDKSGCRDFVDNAAFKAYLVNELLLSNVVVDLIIAAADGCGHCACNHDVF